MLLSLGGLKPIFIQGYFNKELLGFGSSRATLRQNTACLLLLLLLDPENALDAHRGWRCLTGESSGAARNFGWDDRTSLEICETRDRSSFFQSFRWA